MPVPLTGSFVPTTNIWDVSFVQDVDVRSPEFKELLIRLYQNINNMALVVNTKDSGYYNVFPFITSALFFPNTTSTAFRPVIRQTVNFGALPNAGTKSVAHGIAFTPMTTVTKIYGAASDTTGGNYIPLPYASTTLVNNIELNLDSTNVNITTGSNRSNFTISYVIIEYITT